MPVDVFISYARPDRPIAEQVALLLAKHGRSVWWDMSLAPGAVFGPEIERQLAGASVVLVLWSRHSVTSAWVLDEATEARTRGTILPVRLDDSAVPFGFRQIHTGDLTGFDGSITHPALVELMAIVEDRLAGRAHLKDAKIEQVSSVRALLRRPQYRALGLVLGVFVAVAAAWWTYVVTRADDDGAVPTADSVGRVRQYYQTFDPPLAASVEPGLTMIDQLWHVGEADSGWEGSLDHGGYTICNPNDATRVYRNRFTTRGDDGALLDMGDARVAMNVRVAPPNTTHSGIGVLFRSNPDASRYLAFLVNAGSVLTLLEQHGDNLRVLWSSEIEPASPLAVEGRRPADGRAIAVEGRGPDVLLEVDGKVVHIESNLPYTDGDVGVFAYSTGCFGIDDLAVFRAAPAE